MDRSGAEVDEAAWINRPVRSPVVPEELPALGRRESECADEDVLERRAVSGKVEPRIGAVGRIEDEVLADTVRTESGDDAGEIRRDDVGEDDDGILLLDRPRDALHVRSVEVDSHR